MLSTVPKNRADDSLTPSGSKRVGSHGLLTVIMYQRTPSAPCSATASHGSTAFPRDLDILRPSASRIRSFTITLRNAGPRPSIVEMACSE